MIDPKNLTRTELETRVRWYDKKYGPYYEKRGLRNIKNLFRKPNLLELTILVMLLLTFYSAWAYKQDTYLCEETILEYNSYIINQSKSERNSTGGVFQGINLSEINITVIKPDEENSGEEEVS